MVCHQRSIIRNSLKENEAQGNLKGPEVPLDPPTALGWVCLISHHAKTRDSCNPSHVLLLFPKLSITFFNALQALDLFKLLFTIAEGLGAHLHLVHHREKQSGELAVGFACVVESTATLNATTGPAKDDHWKLIVIV